MLLDMIIYIIVLKCPNYYILKCLQILETTIQNLVETNIVAINFNQVVKFQGFKKKSC